MKHFYIAIFSVCFFTTSLLLQAQTPTEQGCDIRRSGSNCVGQAITFYPDCPNDSFTSFSWYIDGTFIKTGASYTHTFTTKGSHTVKLGSSCGNSTMCDYPKPIFRQISVYIEDVPKPAITASARQLCETGNVTLSVVGDEEYTTLDYIWRSVPSGYTAIGRSVTFNNISTSTTFYATASGEACTSESSSIVVSVGRTELEPQLKEENFYHRKVLVTSSSRVNHYWELSGEGTDVSHPVNGNYTVYESGDYYIRYYLESLNCWAAPKGPLHVDVDYVPPLASAIQVQKAGYNEVYLTNDEKEYIFSYADYYWVDGSGENPVILKPYNSNLNVVGSKLYKDGTYYLKGRDRVTNTWGPTFILSVSTRSDENLNWTHSISYDGTKTTINGSIAEKSIAESKSFFDEGGSVLQTQSKSFTTNKIFAIQNLRDRYDRVVGATLPAPINSTDFKYNGAFMLTSAGDIYDYTDFDNVNPDNVNGNTINNPLAVGNEEGTLGWYYSERNSLEPLTPKTAYPYDRTEFYEDGTGEVKRMAVAGDVVHLGTGNEIWNATFPVYNELNDYAVKRSIILPGISGATTLGEQSLQQVGRDQNKKFSVSWTDKAGRVIMAGRFGSPQNYVLKVDNIVSYTPGKSGEKRTFYLTNEQEVTLSASKETTAVIVNTITGERFPIVVPNSVTTGPKLPIGFYKIESAGNSDFSLKYKNHFLDISCQFYDDAGRLVSSVSPNGMKEWLASTDAKSKYSEIDKTTYRYNFRGWLMSMNETDAGETKYQYRKDGSIRFSQNAQQLANKHFSYTLYDAIGRPAESGEYTGTQYTYASLGTQLEFENQVQFATTDTRDWVTTHYDYPDGSFNSATNLGSLYRQDFTDGTVSWSENANMRTWYSYDELGRVTWMVQKPTGLERVFAVKYTYSFIGNVLKVENLSYSVGGVLLEQFYHYYEYDADGRLSKVYTSATSEDDKKLRATYRYYLHGPLKRIELGDKLQGVDFVYNIHGWLTQINHPDKSKDPGKDGNDVFGMILNYYENDLANVFGKNEKMQVPNPDNFHNLPHMLMNDGTPSLAFDPKTAYRENMLDNLKQLQAMHTQDEGQDLELNDPMLERTAPIPHGELSIASPHFAVSDTLAVASTKPVLYTEVETNVVPDDVEFAALKDIFTSLGGTGWLKKTNWPTTWPATATSAVFSKWFGVSVVNGDVVSISLPSNRLAGTIPASISNLTELTTLYLQGNSISGSIPTEIGSLSKLTLLYLYANKLTGTIPASLGNLKNLVYLYLLRNTLTGTIPSELSGMTSLQYLGLDENGLSGNLPPFIGSMTNLVYLNLYNNAFTGSIPVEWNALTNLKTLSLNTNKLSGSIPVLDKLTKLVTLDLRTNAFTGEIPLWLAACTDLENLYLGANKLTGTIPASLGALHKLKVLTLNTNALKGSLPPSLGELSELVTLYVNQNQLSGELPPSYGLLSKLQTYSAGENKLTGNIPESYSNLKELVYFNVSSNQLSGDLPDIFSSWTKATSFYISTNKFTGTVPASVGSMTSLIYCYLNNNAFTSVPPSLLNLTKAVYIILEGNKLHDIPDFSTLPNRAVLYLYVRNNYLDAADLEPLYSGVNVAAFKSLMATPQLVDPGMRISVPQGEELMITAGGKTANTSFVWEKQSGTTWTDVTSANQSSSPDVFNIVSPVATDAGIYRYKVTTSKITALSIISNTIKVQTVDALPESSSTDDVLYNGLITSVQWRTDEAYSAGTGDYYGRYQYAYDEKYQLKEANYADFNKATQMFDPAGNNYRVAGMSYDPNGNILTLKRFDGDGLYKNNLVYNYLANTNRLDNVDTYVNKYKYNQIGQLTAEDKVTGADQYIEYDVTGKVRKVFMDAVKAVPNVEYLYDDRGFRLAKIAYQDKRTTWYIRDASGNILSIYEQAGVLSDPVRPIQWSTLTNVVNTNGTLTVQSGATTGGAWAANKLAEYQDGYVEYTIVDKFQPKDIGFNVPGMGSCMFNFYPSPYATITIRKNGAFQGGFTYNIGDKIKLEKVGDKLRFLQNGKVQFEIVGVAAKTAQLLVNLNAATASVSNLVFKAYATEKQLPSLTQVEVPIYGSGKLGTYYPAQDGSAAYEITDHLGNVRALVRENVNIYTATMEDNGTAELTNPRVTEMNYFQNIFDTEVKDVQMNHTKPLATVEGPDKTAYLYWVGGTQGMDVQDKSVGPAIALKVGAGDRINLETWARYEHKEDFTEDVSLMMFSQLLGTSFAYVQGFDAMSVSQATETFKGALPSLLGAGVNASQPRAFLNYIVFNTKMEAVVSDRIQVSEAAGFEPDERAVPDMFEKLKMDVTIKEPGYIYAWVSNGSENTKVWFDDFSVTHTSNFVTQATDYSAWGDVMREQKTDESIYRYNYQGQFAERDLETGWNHFELREFDPVIGRWTATDPAGQYWSSYIGMGNNPVSGVDPDGAYSQFGAWWRNGFSSEGLIYDDINKDWGYQTSGIENGVVWFSGDFGGKVGNEQNFLSQVQQFLSDINPVESVDAYIGAVAKTEINLVAGSKVVVPIGGIQLSANTETGGRADYVTAAQTYANLQNGPVDIRVIPLNGIGTGDYDPGIRTLYTVHKGVIIVPAGDIPVPIGDYKLQGDATLNPLTNRYTLGARGVAETFSFPSFKKGTSGIRFEVNAGVRFRLKIPDIFKK